MTIDVRLDWESVSVQNDLVRQISIGMYAIVVNTENEFYSGNHIWIDQADSFPITWTYSAVRADYAIPGNNKLRLQVHGGNGPGDNPSEIKEIQFYDFYFAYWGYYDTLTGHYTYGVERLDSIAASAVFTVVDPPGFSPIDIRDKYGYLTGNYSDYTALYQINDKPYSGAVPRAATRGRSHPRQVVFERPRV